MNLNLNPRYLAFKYIEAAFDGREETISSDAEKLSHEDHALFQEISHGTMREWFFLEWALSKNAKKVPRQNLAILIYLSAYQILFLDRVPVYAVFSEAKAIGEALRFSEPELGFMFGILKRIESEKPALLEDRAQALTKALKGIYPKTELDWAILNTTPDFVKVLGHDQTKVIKALAAMKSKPSLVGYLLPESNLESDFERYKSSIAPRAVHIDSYQSIQNPKVRVQGEASQWACDVAADFIAKAGPVVRILEVASGKGGKLLGTLTALSHKMKSFPRIEWFAVDPSPSQLWVLKNSTIPLVTEHWPQVSVHVLEHMSEVQDTPLTFDLVWLDAPCTGFGTLSKLPQISLTRTKDAFENAKRFSSLQKDLASQGAAMLASEGRFLYSVCTMTPYETFDVVRFCEERIGREADFEEYLWPGDEPAPRAEGFFVAMI